MASRGQTADYFPITVGNAWTYYTPLDSVPPDTIWDRSSGVAGTVVLNDTVYVVADYPFSLSDTIRADDHGRIFARIADGDVLLFDFTGSSGETYSVQDRAGIMYSVDTEHRPTCEVAAGRFENCVRLTFENLQVLDAGAIFEFAPGVGIVRAYGDGGWYEELFEAHVDGRIISSRETTGLLAPASEVFPNPFRDSATIVVPSAGVSPPTLRVYDVQGRLVAIPTVGSCGGLQCRFELDGSRLAEGAYFIRSVQAGRVRTIRLIRRR